MRMEGGGVSISEMKLSFSEEPSEREAYIFFVDPSSRALLKPKGSEMCVTL